MGLIQTVATWASRYAAVPPPLPMVDNFWPYANMGGHVYPFGLQTTMPGTKSEEIGGGFDSLVSQAYKANSVVFACMLTRLSIFSEARFSFRKISTEGRPGDLFGGTDGRNPANRDLAMLANPWGGSSTTGDLLVRMITDADLAGNFFAVRRAGNRIRRLRPDWVSIILGSEEDSSVDSWDIDAEVVGYAYYPGGRHSGRKAEFLLPEQVAHFAPIPDPTAAYRGMSWLSPLIREIMGDSAATAHKLKFFENGATPNMVVKRNDDIAGQGFKDWVKLMEEGHAGAANAYKTLYLTAGADATVVGANLQQVDFKVTQGAGETRIAADAGVHPVIVGLSEGLQGSSLNSGNFQSARRLVADRTMRPLWRMAAGSLGTIINVPPAAELWYDDRGIAFVREDQKDAADIELVKAQTLRQLIDGGFKADDAVAAVEAADLGLLKGKHTGLFSVQLQAPGSTKMPAGEAPGETPVGPGTKPEVIPAGEPSTKPVTGGAVANGNGRSMELLAAFAAGASTSRTNVTFPEGFIQHHVTVEPAQLTIEEGAIQSHTTVEPAQVTIEEGAVRVDAPVTVEPAQVTIEEGAIRSETTVETPAVTIEEGAVRVETPEVHVETDTSAFTDAVADVQASIEKLSKPRKRRIVRDAGGRIVGLDDR